MCGIAAIIHGHDETVSGRRVENAALLHSMLDKVRYRGDAENFGESMVFDRFACGTNRLAILDRSHAFQPMSDAESRFWVVFNGEVYNHNSLRPELQALGYSFQTAADTEVLLHAYREWGPRLVHKLDGVFAFIVYDSATGHFVAARDRIGVKPLYYSVAAGSHYFASEQKCLLALGQRIQTMPPAHMMVDGNLVCYYELDDSAPQMGVDEMTREVHRLFEEAVEKRVDTDLPVAVTLSGGLDSTAVLHCARKYHPNVTAFTVGLRQSTDVEVASRYCQEHSIPHRIHYLTEEEVVSVLPQVVYTSEMFEGVDVVETCISHILFREVHRAGIKVALCGEGSDELLAGYKVFKEREDRTELMKYKLWNIHRTDAQRVDRSSMANSVEARVPFLDQAFVELVYRIPMEYKLRHGVEKWIFRQAFLDDLPDYITYRPKMAMHEGSGMKDLLYQYAAQGASLPEGAARQLNIRSHQEEFFLGQYLAAGFPIPRERFRQTGFDVQCDGVPNATAAVVEGRWQSAVFEVKNL